MDKEYIFVIQERPSREHFLSNLAEPKQISRKWNSMKDIVWQNDAIKIRKEIALKAALLERWMGSRKYSSLLQGKNTQREASGLYTM